MGGAVDPRIVFWTGALANMALIVILALRGVRQIRRGEIAAHRRSMLTACVLVALFLGSYLLKRSVLGGEDLSVWSRPALVNLWVHESFVALMLVAGGTALVLGRRLARTRRVTGQAHDPPADPARIRRHRRAGWTAIVASFFGLATACGILAGMLTRS